MDKIPFSVYDFFGYLASGFVLLVSIVAAFVGHKPLLVTPSVIMSVLLVVVSYIAGHLIANMAGYLVERCLVNGVLGMPTGILVGARRLSPLLARVFPGYAVPLPSGVRSRIVARAEGFGITDQNEALFFHCHALLKCDANVQARLNTFLNLYGFCRNMSLAMVIAAAVLGAGLIGHTADTGPDVDPIWWIAGAVIAAIGLFYRYLKFLRQFGIELLTSYAEVS